MAKFDPYNHFGFLTNRVARLIVLVATPHMQRMGYTFPSSCLGVLADLWQQDGITQKELGSSLVKNKSSITKMLASLEETGLVIKKDDPTDRRNKLIFLTQKGKSFRQEIEKMRVEMEKKLLRDITPEETKIAKKVLKSFYLNLSEELFKQHSNE